MHREGMTIQRCSSQTLPELLEEVRRLAAVEGQQLQSALDEGRSDWVEEKTGYECDGGLVGGRGLRALWRLGIAASLVRTMTGRGWMSGARTTTPRHVQAASSRRCRRFAEGGQVAPLVWSIDRLLVVPCIARIDLCSPISRDEPSKRFNRSERHR
jgi:hypothetical protein